MPDLNGSKTDYWQHRTVDSTVHLGADGTANVHLHITIGNQGDAAAWSDLPPNVHVEQWVPQRDVLNEASTIVCHGGMGTLLGALTAAVPAVVVPQFADQPHNADRIEATNDGEDR